jgi:hypothetical protein
VESRRPPNYRGALKGISTLLAVFVLTTPDLAAAQTSKLVEKTDMSGQAVQTPYINYNEYENISVNGKIAFRDLLSASSVDEIIQYLGQPKTIDRHEFAGRERFGAELHYEGATVEYDNYEGGVSGITSIEIRSPGWFLTVGSKTLRPGMTADRLSPAVRKSLQKRTTSDDPNLDRFSVVHIAKPGSAKSGDVELLQDGKAQITVYVNAVTGTVERIRFSRLGP